MTVDEAKAAAIEVAGDLTRGFWIGLEVLINAFFFGVVLAMVCLPLTLLVWAVFV